MGPRVQHPHSLQQLQLLSGHPKSSLKTNGKEVELSSSLAVGGDLARARRRTERAGMRPGDARRRGRTPGAGVGWGGVQDRGAAAGPLPSGHSSVLSSACRVGSRLSHKRLQRPQARASLPGLSQPR